MTEGCVKLGDGGAADVGGNGEFDEFVVVEGVTAGGLCVVVEAVDDAVGGGGGVSVVVIVCVLLEPAAAATEYRIGGN